MEARGGASGEKAVSNRKLTLPVSVLNMVTEAKNIS